MAGLTELHSTTVDADIADVDPEVADQIDAELRRQRRGLDAHPRYPGVRELAVTGSAG